MFDTLYELEVELSIHKVGLETGFPDFARAGVWLTQIVIIRYE